MLRRDEGGVVGIVLPLVSKKRISVVAVMTRQRHGRHSPKRQDHQLGPISLLISAYRRLFSKGVCVFFGGGGTDNGDL